MVKILDFNSVTKSYCVYVFFVLYATFLSLKIQLLNHYVLIKSLISLNCEKLPRPKI